MANLSNESTITHTSDNLTKVILADAAFRSTNSDGVNRFELRYNGSGGYITGNTLFALDMQTVGQKVLPATASSADITKGKTAWINGVLVTGTRPAPSTYQSGTFSMSSASIEHLYKTIYFSPEFDTTPKVEYTLSGSRMSMYNVTVTRTYVTFDIYHSHGSDHHTATVNWTATAS